MYRSSILLLTLSWLGNSLGGELIGNLDDKDIHAVAFRLQDEKEKRLLLENDVNVIMLKLGKLERRITDLEKDKDSTSCPSDWKRHGESCFFFSQGSTSWLEAARICRDKGGRLAEINTQAEKEFIGAKANTEQGPHWVGGTDAFTEAQWVWVSTMESVSEPLLTWNVGQPDNAGDNEHCLEIYYGGKTFNDRPCSYTNKYVCEM